MSATSRKRSGLRRALVTAAACAVVAGASYGATTTYAQWRDNAPVTAETITSGELDFGWDFASAEYYKVAAYDTGVIPWGPVKVDKDWPVNPGDVMRVAVPATKKWAGDNLQAQFECSIPDTSGAAVDPKLNWTSYGAPDAPTAVYKFDQPADGRLSTGWHTLGKWNLVGFTTDYKVPGTISTGTAYALDLDIQCNVKQVR